MYRIQNLTTICFAAMLAISLVQATTAIGIARAQSSTCASSVENAPPPSRAGDVRAAFDYTTEFTDILSQIVTNDGLVRYRLLHGPLMDDFRSVLKAVEEFDVRTLTSDKEKLAFWMNAYNVQMLQNILENPDATNIIENGYADEFFKTPVRAAGLGITLDQIEHVLLRQQKGSPHLERHRIERFDPRLHVGINCAAVSCPCASVSSLYSVERG